MNREREPLPTRVQDTQDLPAGYDDALREGLRALGWPLDSRARDTIDGHVRMLLAWTSAINLTAIREPAEVAVAHILDSLSAVGPMRERGITRFLDLGSGGGLPGLPVAAALPATEALLVEAIGKKARFLATAIAATGLHATVQIASVRAETLAAEPHHRGRWPAITARAVASAGDLVELAFPLLAPGGVLIAWKRGDLADELRAARSAARALGGGTVEVLDVDLPDLAGHCLLLMTRTGVVPDAYPRDPATRKRRPW